MNTGKLKPLVSIILPTHNRSLFLIKTIASITSQTYTNFELIIINDCSRDDTAQVLLDASMKEPRIKIINHSENLKIIRSLNEGTQVASGVYIARADDDDPWQDSTKLEKQINFLESNPEYMLVGTGATLVDENGHEIFRYRTPESDKSIRARMLFGNPFIHPSVVFRKSVLDKTGSYDVLLKDAEDWDLWMRMGQYGKLRNLPSFSVARFYGARGLSIKNRVNISQTRLELIKKYRKFYPNFILALIFNYLQRIYIYLPYTQRLDILLFKAKRVSLAKKGN
ncbi:MAG: glycosyltransferase family 2 protein [Patescibacteria group bacterium]